MLSISSWRSGERWPRLLSTAEQAFVQIRRQALYRDGAAVYTQDAAVISGMRWMAPASPVFAGQARSHR